MGGTVRLLIGIDDTDNLESRGTGYRARQLGRRLVGSNRWVRGISRHQLLVDDRIPYTSHNSAACLDVETVPERLESVVELAREFLQRESAAGSDAGLCVAQVDQVTHEVMAFGRRAKAEVVQLSEAHALARRYGLELEGVTGTRIGAIGALAAVGLRAAGNDGRVLWLEGLRELDGVWSVADLREALPVVVETVFGQAAGAEDRVDLGDWVRPILREGRMVLLVERPDVGQAAVGVADHGEPRASGEAGDEGRGRERSGTTRDEHIEWVVADRTRIKQLSQ